MQHDSQLTFTFLSPRRKVTAIFDQAEITTDAGLLPLKEYDSKIGYLDSINAAIDDPRQPSKIIHEQRTQLAQRLYGIVAGYEDCNDHQRLRHDPTFKTIADRVPFQAPLASQSSLCRLENRISAQDFHSLLGVLLDTYRDTGRKTGSVILDLDTTDDRCHGQQQLSLFNAYYQHQIYLPLLIFEGNSGHLLSARLRSGGKPSGKEVVTDHVQPVVEGLRARHCGLRIRLRGDAEFAAPGLYEYLEGARVGYAISMAGWPPLHAQTRAARVRAERAYRKTQKPQTRFGDLGYRAQSWHRPRRIVYKIEVTASGTALRFLVTNLTTSPVKVFAFYDQRGECENRIKELKCGCAADRLSCHDFSANAFRLLLHALAYNLHNLFRLRLASTALACAQISTMRQQLFKVGALVQLTSRRLWFRLSRNWPGAGLFHTVCRIIRALPSLAST